LPYVNALNMGEFLQGTK